MTDSMKQLLNQLMEQNIQVELEGEDNLRILKNISEVPAHVLKALKEQKKELIAYLKTKQSSGARQKYKHIPKAEQKDYYALSSAQRRLYFLQSLSPESTSYNMPYYQHFNEDLDLDRLEQSLQKLIERHEILRTCFVEELGNTVQKILDHIDFRTEVYDCTTQEEADEQTKNAIRPFDLSRAPLFRSTVIKINGSYLWIADIHHIVSDGTSQEVLISDLMSIYQGEELPPLKLAYKDYSEWQNKLSENGELLQQQAYWNEKLNGELPMLNFPADHYRPAAFTFQGASYTFSIDKNKTALLKEMGDRNRGSLQMSLITILKTLVFKYTDQEDSIIGCGISGRSHDELQRIVGMFVNMLAIRSAPSGDKSFSAFYKEVISSSLEAYDNQDLQFDDLVDALQISRDVSRNPIFDIALIVQNFDRAKLKEEKEITSAMSSDNAFNVKAQQNTSKFDLTFFAIEAGDQIEIIIEYYTGIFNESTIKRIADHFNEIVKQVTEHENILLADIDLVSEKERVKLVRQFNDTTTEYPRTSSVHDLFSAQCALNPDKVAVSDKTGSYTYLETELRSNKLANFLREGLNMPMESYIGILQFRTREIIPSILGILKSGCAYLNLDPELPEERLLFMLKDAKVSCLLVEKSLVGLASRLQWRSEVKHVVAVDSEDIFSEHGGLRNELTRKDLWDYVGDRAVDAITAGGWLSSYTGAPLSKQEMQEYSDNAYLKLKSILHKEMKVLEIGCSSGLTMFQVAPGVKSYYGTDLSSTILDYTRKVAVENGHHNIFLSCMPADEIETLGEKEFDLIIINSVIQCFEDHNYLRGVLKKSLGLLKDQGCIFAGDIMDEEKRMTLIQELQDFKNADEKNEFKTKTEWSSELFVSKDYFKDLMAEDLGIRELVFSDKIHTIENELTRFRYDVLLNIDKKGSFKTKTKSRQQYDLTEIRKYKDSNPVLKVGPDNLCYLMYTSGSTGLPKGVMIEHRSVVRLVKDTNIYSFSSSDKIISTGALSFDAITFEYWGPLLNGGELIMCSQNVLLDSKLLKREIKSRSVNIMWFTAGWLHLLIESEIDVFSGLKTIIAGGDKLSPAHIQKLRKKYPALEIINGYGPTENTTFSLTHLIEEVNNNIPIGKPISNSSAYILNKKNTLQPIGVIGEICVSGDGLARGYLNQEMLTRQKFIDHPLIKGERLYKTGDLGRWFENGTVEFIGRLDDQVKIRGYRIELGEIEHALLKHAEIEEAVVLVKVNKEKEKELIAYITSEKQQSLSELRLFLKQSIPEYMLPARYIQLETLPLTLNGKVNKKKLLELDVLNMPTGVEYVAAENELQEKLVKIWEQLLQRSAIGIYEDFFFIGGHSLKATRLVSEYHKTFDVKLSLKDLFTHTTVSAHARLIQASKKSGFVQIEKTAEQANYPISSAQRRLWVLSQFDSGSAAYNIPWVTYLDQVIDVDSFKKAVNSTIERHEILRTVFKENETGEIRQWVMTGNDLNFEMDYKDYSHEKNKQEKIENDIAEDSYKTFDLVHGPLLRATLFRSEENNFVFYFNIHHIISDGWSMEVLSKNIFSFYSAYKENKKPELKELRIQYKDYSAWQMSQTEGESFSKHKDYWLNSLAGELPLLNLPEAKLRPAVKTYNGRSMGTYLDKDTSNKLKEFSMQNGGTLFMGMLASFHALLYRYTGQNDQIIGSPVAGREHADLEDQVGFYVNTLALRNEIWPVDNFKDLFSRVKQNTLQAYLHQVYPFDKLVEDLELVRDTSRSAVFDVMFVLQNNGENLNDFELSADHQGRVMDYGSKTSKFDLLITAQEQGDYLWLSVEYNTDVYEEKIIRRFIDHYKRFVSALLSHPELEIGKIDYLSEKEKFELITTFNDTKKEYSDKTVIELFEAQVRKNPEKISLQFEDRSLTYKELNEQSNHLAYLLKNKFNATNNTKIGVILGRSLESVIAMVAIMKAGCCYVPVDREYPAERVAYIIEDADLQVIISKEALCERHHQAFQRLLDIDKLEVIENKEQDLQVTSEPADGSYAIYTSGSTGNPKGVLQTYRTLNNLIHWEMQHSGIERNLKHLQYMSFSFDVHLQDYWAALCAGGTLYIAGDELRLDFVSLWNYITTNAIQVLSFPVSVFQQLLLQIPENDLEASFIKHIVVSGEQLLINPLLKNFLELNPHLQLHNHYGRSETHVVTSHKISSNFQNIKPRASIGKPVSNTRIYILDAQMQLVPSGVKGELYIGGHHLAAGYLNKTEFTAERFVADPFQSGALLYKTGDYGYWCDNGTIEFVGRKDDQVKIRGYRIELSEIEQVLRSYQDIESAVVLVKEDSNKVKELVAYITAKAEQNTDELRAYLKQRLPDYMLPSGFVQLANMPHNSNGKIDKKSLPHSHGLKLASGAEYVAPRNEIEKKLVEIWEEILQQKNIGIKDDFFEMGGHSLKLIRVISRIQAEYNIKFELTKLFQLTTIEAIAEMISLMKFSYSGTESEMEEFKI